MKKYYAILLFLFFSIFISAQENYTVPKDVKFENKEDYAAYEPQVKETISWLLDTPLAKDSNKRKEAGAFFLMWLTGTPDVSIEVNTDIIPFINDNPELLLPFMAGCVRYSLDNNHDKDALKINVAGIETAVSFYRKNRGYLKKDGSIEKYEKLIQKGKLEQDLQKKLDKQTKK